MLRLVVVVVRRRDVISGVAGTVIAVLGVGATVAALVALLALVANDALLVVPRIRCGTCQEGARSLTTIRSGLRAVTTFSPSSVRYPVRHSGLSCMISRSG